MTARPMVVGTALVLAVTALAGAGTSVHARVTVSADPTRPPLEVNAGQGQRSAPQQWQLGSVLVSEARRVAVINGQVVAEGDHVGGARVTRIDPSSVELRAPGRAGSIELTLRTVQVRTPGTPERGLSAVRPDGGGAGR